MATSKTVASKAGKLLPAKNVPQKAKAPIASALAQTPRKATAKRG